MALISIDNDVINVYSNIKILIQVQNPSLIYICLRAIADYNIIMNFMKNDNNYDKDFLDDTLNFGEMKKRNKRNINEQ